MTETIDTHINEILVKAINQSMNQTNSSCRTWFYRVKQFLISIDQEHMFRARRASMSQYFDNLIWDTFL